MGLLSVIISGLARIQNNIQKPRQYCTNMSGEPVPLPTKEHQVDFRISVKSFFLVTAALHVVGFICFLIVEFTPLMRNHTNPLVFLEELDRQRQLDRDSAKGQVTTGVPPASPLAKQRRHQGLRTTSDNDRTPLLANSEPDPLYGDDPKFFSFDADSTPRLAPRNSSRGRSHRQRSSVIAIVDDDDSDDANVARVDEDASDQPAAESHNYNWRMCKAGASPVINQGVKAFFVYFVNPGLMTYLTNDLQLISTLMLVAMVSNLFGRFATGFVRIHHITALNVLCTFFFAYELFVGLSHFPAPVSQTWLIPVTGIYALLNGYLSTVVYLVADEYAVAEFPDEADSQPAARTIRRWISLVNTAGSVLGAFTCTLFTNTGLLHAKVGECSALSTTSISTSITASIALFPTSTSMQ